MSKSLRIRTTPNGEDNYLKVKLEQDFDFIEILSLKISQEDAYRNFCSDYGVVVGRVSVNNGYGVPNAKVSVFVPLTDEDSFDPEISDLYPYEITTDVNGDGIRYNLLPSTSEVKDDCFTQIGTFPTKREILDNNELGEVYQKYYKYTTTTNQSGDYMFFGVPTGQYLVHVDADISDIGIASVKPYDLIRQGVNHRKFESPTKFRGGEQLNKLVQVKTSSPLGTRIRPFWGEEEGCDIGITRVDVDLNETITPHAIFMGSIVGDDDKNSISKRCKPRKKSGELEELVTSAGRIEMIRKTDDGGVERFDVEGGSVIDDDGVWSYQIPMNLDYMVTNEEGELVPSNNPVFGLPTRARVRFRIGMYGDGSTGRLRTRAKFLVPNNPQTQATADYSFGEDTKDESFKDLSFNKVYSVKSFIPRFDNSKQLNGQSAISIKNVSKSTAGRTPFPFNKMSTTLNPIFLMLCLILNTVVGTLLFMLNQITINILNFVLLILNGILAVICRIVFTVMQVVTALNTNTDNKRIRRCSSCIGKATCEDSDGNEIELDCSGSIVEGDIITTVPIEACKDKIKCECKEPLGYIPYIVMKCQDKCYAPYATARIPDKVPTENANKDCGRIFWPGDDSDGDGDDDGYDAGYFDCVTAALAEALDAFKFLFYNDWVNGVLYSTIFKYKLRRKGEGREKFCEYDCDEFTNSPNYTGVNNDGDDDPDNKCRINFIVEGSLCDCGINDGERKGVGCDNNVQIRDGLIKKVDDEFYYAAITHDGDYPLFKSDIIMMGSILDCDWEGIPNIINEFPESSYHMPEIVTDEDGTRGIEPLFADKINCFFVDTDEYNVSNIKRYCELGVGDSEDRLDNGGLAADDYITEDDIENKVVRNIFAWLNDPVLSTNAIDSVDVGFGNVQYKCEGIGTSDYNRFRFNDPSSSPADLSSIDRLKKYQSSFYFYFGLNVGRTALRKTQIKYFSQCNVVDKSEFNVVGTVSNASTSNDGSITLDVDGGRAPYTYSWDGPAGFPTSTAKDISGLSRGTYTVRVLDDANNFVASTFIVGGPPPLSFVLNGTNATSNLANDGKINITFIGGGTGGPYTLKENGTTITTNAPTTLPELDNKAAGTYTFILSDGISTYTDSIIITAPPALGMVLTPTHPICATDSDGRIDVVTTGGVPPFTYQWMGPAGFSETNKNVIGLVSGSYAVEVTDAQNNTSDAGIILTSSSSVAFGTTIIKHCGCKGGNNGSIEVQGVGDGPFDYIHNLGPDSVSELNKTTLFDTGHVLPPSQDHRIVIRNVDDCVVSDVFTILEPPSTLNTGYSSSNPLGIGDARVSGCVPAGATSATCYYKRRYRIYANSISGGWNSRDINWWYSIDNVNWTILSWSNVYSIDWTPRDTVTAGGTVLVRYSIRDSRSDINLCNWQYSNPTTLNANLFAKTCTSPICP